MYPLLRQKRPNLEGKTTIRATNEDGLAIGFLLGRSSESGTDWERIGFDPDPSDGSSATWTPDNGGSGPVTIAAVPCLALSEPSEAVATKVFAIGPGKLSQASEPLQPTPGHGKPPATRHLYPVRPQALREQSLEAATLPIRTSVSESTPGTMTALAVAGMAPIM